MRVIAVIERRDVVEHILSHLGLLISGMASRPPPRTALPAQGNAGPREWTYEPPFDDLVAGDPAN